MKKYTIILCSFMVFLSARCSDIGVMTPSDLGDLINNFPSVVKEMPLAIKATDPYEDGNIGCDDLMTELAQSISDFLEQRKIKISVDREKK